MRHKVWLAVLAALFFVVGGFLLFAYADSKSYWKILDPNDPQFNVEAFAFNDYGSHDELAEALKILTPPGTPFEVADKIMRGPRGSGGRDVTMEKDRIFENLTLKQKVSKKGVKIDIEKLKSRTNRIVFYASGGRWKLMNPNWGGWNVKVFYDDQGRVVQIMAGSEILFNEGRIQ